MAVMLIQEIWPAPEVTLLLFIFLFNRILQFTKLAGDVAVYN